MKKTQVSLESPNFMQKSQTNYCKKTACYYYFVSFIAVGVVFKKKTYLQNIDYNHTYTAVLLHIQIPYLCEILSILLQDFHREVKNQPQKFPRRIYIQSMINKQISLALCSQDLQHVYHLESSYLSA